MAGACFLKEVIPVGSGEIALQHAAILETGDRNRMARDRCENAPEKGRA